MLVSRPGLAYDGPATSRRQPGRQHASNPHAPTPVPRRPPGGGDRPARGPGPRPRRIRPRPGGDRLPDPAGRDRRHPRRPADPADPRQPEPRHRGPARAAGDAVDRRGLAPHAAARRLPAQPADQRPAHQRRREPRHREAHRRRRRARVRRAARDLARRLRVLARRLAPAVHPHPLQRHRGVGHGHRDRAAPPHQRRVRQRRVGQPLRLARRGEHGSLPVQGFRPGGAPRRARVAGRPEHPGAPGRRRAHPHLPGPAAERPRRGAVRVLLHQPDRHRRPRHRPAHRRRPTRPLRAGQRLPERRAPAHCRGRAPVFVAGPGQQLPQGRDGAEPQRRDRGVDRPAAPRRRRPHRRRPHRAAPPHVGPHPARHPRVGRGRGRRRPPRHGAAPRPRPRPRRAVRRRAGRDRPHRIPLRRHLVDRGRHRAADRERPAHPVDADHPARRRRRAPHPLGPQHRGPLRRRRPPPRRPAAGRGGHPRRPMAPST